MKSQKLIGLISSLLIVGATLLAIVFQQNIIDWWRLRDYTAPAEIAKLAAATGMNESSKRIFYVNHPVIADRELFNEQCRDNEYTIVLGCYLPGQRGIYLLDVTDNRIQGVEEVTAAHEMLHAAYERLNSKDRAWVDQMLSEAFGKLSNARVRETIELYRKQDPLVVPNELHSILGTEVRKLPAELETYYRRYFTDRSRVVTFSEQYEQAFIDRRNAVRDYDVQLGSLKAQIETLSVQLDQTSAELQEQRQNMNQLRSSGQTDSFNSQVAGYNAKVKQFNRDIDRLSGYVAEYNVIVAERNAVASEEAELVKAIDSREVVPEQH